MTKNKTKQLMTWKHIAGGCGCGCAANYPCDDQYENKETGEKRSVFTTLDRHFNMPESVKSFDDLFLLDGVCQPWELNNHLFCESETNDE